MRKRKHIIATVLLTLALGGCGGSTAKNPLPPPPAPSKDPAAVTWNQEIGGLSYRIEAADDLNHDGDRPLGVTLCVYQLEDPSAFQALASSPAGLDTLLNCQLDAVKACASRPFKMQPGKALDLTVDRAEKARYFAVVAGYKHLKPELCTAVIPFPIHHEKEGLIFRNDLYTAAPVQALIHLGADSVTLSGVERAQ